MPTDRPSKLLASRLSRLVDGLLDENEAAELEEMLRRTPAAREYYRYLMLTHREGFAIYLKQQAESVEPEEAFKEGFGMSVEDAEAAFIEALTGG